VLNFAPRILIAEGNTQERCKEMQAIGNISGSSAYAKSIKHVCPGVKIDVVFAADNNASLPNGTSFDDYDGFILGGSALNLPSDAGNINITRQIGVCKLLHLRRVALLV
jgi:hypothetical protein